MTRKYELFDQPHPPRLGLSSNDEVLTAGPISSQGDHATLTRTTDGHLIVIGCWSGTVEDLRTLAAGDEWPSGCDPGTRDRYRPRLLAFAGLCEAQIRLFSRSAH